LLTWRPLYAQTGYEFVNDWKEFQKYDAGQSHSNFQLGCYMGFVSGVWTTGGRGYGFKFNSNVTNGQICSVVGKWIGDHPERWTDNPADIVVQALKEAFPLQKKK